MGFVNFSASFDGPPLSGFPAMGHQLSCEEEADDGGFWEEVVAPPEEYPTSVTIVRSLGRGEVGVDQRLSLRAGGLSGRAIPLGAVNLKTMPSSPEVVKETSYMVTCPEGHTMNAKVAREMAQMMRCTSDLLGECSRCEETITKEEAFYRCSDCNVNYCMSCSRELVGLAVDPSRPSLSSRPELELSAGDVLFCGPDRYGIHHTVLVRSKMAQADREMHQLLRLAPGWQLFYMRTIESTQGSKGEDTKWYPSLTFIARDVYTGEAMLVADLPPNSETVYKAAKPVPLKALRHPLRKEMGNPDLQYNAFDEVVESAARESRSYGWSTAVRAVVSSEHSFDANEHPTKEARRKLLRSIRKSWERRPICAAVVIKVWQMYFEALGPTEDDAVQGILRYMPCWCDRTAPSALVKTLSRCGWVLTDGVDA